MIKPFLVGTGAFFTGAFLTNAAFAAIDVTGATTMISTDGTAAITAVGGVMLALAAVAVTFKWVKASIFG